jgi:hypothetical protein
VVDDFHQRRPSVGRGNDSDEQVWILSTHGMLAGANFGPHFARTLMYCRAGIWRIYI